MIFRFQKQKGGFNNRVSTKILLCRSLLNLFLFFSDTKKKRGYAISEETIANIMWLISDQLCTVSDRRLRVIDVEQCLVDTNFARTTTAERAEHQET